MCSFYSECAVGYIQVNDKCEACSVGTYYNSYYSNGRQLGTCISCDDGKTTASTGAMSIDDCGKSPFYTFPASFCHSFKLIIFYQ